MAGPGGSLFTAHACESVNVRVCVCMYLSDRRTQGLSWRGRTRRTRLNVRVFSVCVCVCECVCVKERQSESECVCQ